METKIPAVVNFESEEDDRKAVLRIGEEDGKAIYTFTVLTPRLIRMKDWNIDNTVSLLLDGRWESFTASGLSTLADAEVSAEILENNNKRSRYRIRIAIPGSVPGTLKAKAESLFIE